ncbi:transcription factor ORG2-like [Cynara cardunculus var. scolymus]|nr:transcription factor ORG2-like [Cynara cardunculus var. scolymus]
MLALSPPVFSTTYGWPLEDLITPNLHQQDCNEANSYYNSLTHFPTYDQMKNDFPPESVSLNNGGAGDHAMMVVKKLDHNASERDRRKKVNDLYAFLRSLLPVSSDHKKKVSIPGTVSRALKYIPELQKEVETLKSKKKRLSSSSSTDKTSKDYHVIKSSKDAMVVSSVNALSDKEAVIQLISSADHMSKNKEIGFLSKVLEYLEQEEDGIVLLNATTFKCSGEGMLLNTLHVQVQGDYRIEAEKLKEKLCVFHQ